MITDAEFEKLEQIQHETANEIHKEFPLGTRVKSTIKGKVVFGTVKPKPVEEIICYGHWHVPVKWDHQSFVSSNSKFDIEIVKQ